MQLAIPAEQERIAILQEALEESKKDNIELMEELKRQGKIIEEMGLELAQLAK
jgi:hypothetical protein